MKYAMIIGFLFTSVLVWGQVIFTEDMGPAPSDSIVVKLGATTKQDLLDLYGQIREIHQKIDKIIHQIYDQEKANERIPDWGNLWYWEPADQQLNAIIFKKSKVIQKE